MMEFNLNFSVNIQVSSTLDKMDSLISSFIPSGKQSFQHPKQIVIWYLCVHMWRLYSGLNNT